MNRRHVLLALAVAAALGGLALAFAPGLVPAASLPENAPLFLAAVAVIAGVARAWIWIRHDATQAAPPVRERPAPVAVPGDDFDALLSLAPASGVSSGDQRAFKVRTELSEAAIEVLTRYHGYTREEAQDRLNNGAWTDDPLAAEFFATRGGSGSSITESIRGALGDETPFERRAGRAADEIARIATSRGEA